MWLSWFKSMFNLCTCNLFSIFQLWNTPNQLVIPSKYEMSLYFFLLLMLKITESAINFSDSELLPPRHGKLWSTFNVCANYLCCSVSTFIGYIVNINTSEVTNFWSHSTNCSAGRSCISCLLYKFVSYDHMSKSYNCFISSLDSYPIPSLYQNLYHIHIGKKLRYNR